MSFINHYQRSNFVDRPEQGVLSPKVYSDPSYLPSNGECCPLAFVVIDGVLVQYTWKDGAWQVSTCRPEYYNAEYEEGKITSVCASLTGITSARENGVLTITVPSYEYDIRGFSIHGETADLAEDDTFIIYIKFPDQLPEGYNMLSNYYLPLVQTVDTTNWNDGGPSKTKPFKINKATNPEESFIELGYNVIKIMLTSLNLFDRWEITIRF